MSSTYIQVRNLVDGLLNTKSVVKRRAAGKELQEMLSKPEIRRRLAEEAGSSNRFEGNVIAAAVRRRRTLSEMWRMIVQSTVVAVNDIAIGKSKLTLGDIAMLHKIIQVCSMSNEGYENAYSTSKLSKKEVKNVTKLCLALLEDEDVLRLAELQVLELLVFICSTKEYVAYFRPQPEIQIIMEEIEKRISANEEAITFESREIAAKLFYQTMRTCDQLNISLDLFMENSIKLVANWCSRKLSQNVIRHVVELSDLFNGLTILMYTNQEQSIASLSRSGQIILKFARRCYVNSDDNQRHALNRYIQCHIRIAQMSGKLQGKLPGDLGSIGDASLSLQQIKSLLELVMRDNLKRERPELPLSEQYKSQLDLTSTLLACAQRLYYKDAEWYRLDNPTAAFIADLQSDDDVEDYLQIPRLKKLNKSKPYCPVIAANSPFATHVLQPLASAATGMNHLTIALTEDNDMLISNSMSTEGTEVNEVLISLLREFRKIPTDSSSLNNRNLVPLMQIVCASAESFPMGSCWLSNGEDNWHSLPVVAEIISPPLPVHAGTPNDLFVIVHLVSQILVAHGDSAGHVDVQRWALQTLVKLTEATEAQAYLFRDTPSMLRLLSSSWRNVWMTLFRSDLRYIAYTKDTHNGSAGEFVIILLKCIYQRLCTDLDLYYSESIHHRQSAFLRQRQEQLWSLCLFENPYSQISSNIFDLIRVALVTVGLSETGTDSICKGFAGPNSPSIISVSKRRLRLLFFCLRNLELGLRTAAIESITSCLATLVHGSANTLTADDPNTEFYHKECFPTSTWFKCQNKRISTIIDQRVCSCNSLPENHSSRKILGQIDCTVDVGLTDFGRAASILLQQNIMLKKTSENSDFLSSSSSSSMYSCFSTHFDRVFCSWMKHNNELSNFHNDSFEQNSEQKSSTSILPLCYQLVQTRIKTGVLLLSTNDLFENYMTEVHQLLTQIFLSTIEFIKSYADDDCVFVEIIMQVKGLAQTVIGYAASKRRGVSASLVESSKLLSNFIRNIFRERCGSSNLTERLSQQYLGDALMNEDEFEEPSHMDMDARRREGKYASDNIMNVGSKRICVASSQSAKRQKEDETVYISLSRSCAYALGSLLVTIDPSYDACEIFTSYAVGVTDFMKCEISHADIDILGAIHAYEVICDEATIHQVSRTRHFSSNSVVSLLCRIIQALSNAEGKDPELFPFGFLFCEKLIGLANKEKFDVIVPELEAGIIAEYLKCFFDGVDCRRFTFNPKFRALQLSTTWKCFLKGAESFHKHIDKDFPRLFVLPALSDIDSRVRQHATAAVAAALTVLPEKKVTESVRKRLPPLNPSSHVDFVLDKYRQWYKEKALRRTEDIGNGPEIMLWEDAFHSIQWSVIHCWITIACVTSDLDLFRRVLLDFILLSSSRPELEGLCFRLLDDAAVALGFECVENIIEEELEVILDFWMTRGDPFSMLPMLVTSPNTLRRLERLGSWVAPTCQQNRNDDGQSSEMLDVERLRTFATAEFIVRYRRAIVPLILCQALSAMLEKSVTKEGRRHFLQHPYMRELCSVFYDQFDDDCVKQIVKMHIPEIISVQCLSKLRNDLDGTLSEEIGRLLSALLSATVVQGLGERGAYSACRRLLVLASRWSSGCESENVSTSLLGNAIRSIVDRFGQPVLSNHSMFARIGGSIVEFLIFVRYHFLQSTAIAQLRKRFRAVQYLGSIIVECTLGCELEASQIGSCFTILISLLCSPQTTSLRPDLLRIVKSLIETVFLSIKSNFQSESEIKLAMRELITISMHIHEQCQRSIVSACLQSKYTTDFVRWQSLGLCWTLPLANEARELENEEQDSVVAAFTAYKTHIDTSLMVTAQLAHDIVVLILRDVLLLGLSPDDIKGLVTPFLTPISWYNALAKVDHALCAQHAIENFIISETERAPPLTISIEAAHLHINKQMVGQDTGSSLIDQKMLLTELKHSEVILRRSRLDSSNMFFEENDAVQLACTLAKCCNSNSTENVRKAASRCLGELHRGYVESDPLLTIPNQTTHNIIEKAIAKGKLPDAIRAQCVECLLQVTFGSDARFAMIALETLKAVLTKCVDDEWKSFLSNLQTRRLLESLAFGNSSWRNSSLYLTSNEANRLRGQVINSLDENEDSDNWCWDLNLWNCNGFASDCFSDWLCCVVPSILLCNYKPQSIRFLAKDQEQKTFLALSQRLSCIAPNFALLLFPAVCIDLLQQDIASMRSTNNVFTDASLGSNEKTLNSQLSICFKALMDDNNLPKHGRANGCIDRQRIGLAIDTLDYLRCLTQIQFLTLNEHQRNCNKLHSATLNSSGSSDKADEIKSKRWKGLRYGIVLEIDALCVVRACIRADRFASAILYAELLVDKVSCGSYNLLDYLDTKGKMDVSCVDISGFGSSCLSNEIDFIDEGLLQLLRSLRDGFAELGDYNASEVMDKELSDLLANQSFNASTIDRIGCQQLSPDFLRCLDSTLCMSTIPNPAFVQMASALDHLGMTNVLQLYIQGLKQEHQDILSKADADALRDKWFECSLYNMYWPPPYLQVSCDSNDHNFTTKNLMGNNAGFHECLCLAIRCLENDDFEQCRIQLGEARQFLCEKVSTTIHHKAPMLKISSTMERLQVLNDLDDFVAAQNDLDFFKIYKIVEEDVVNTKNMLQVEVFSEHFEELLMQLLYKKAMLRKDKFVSDKFHHALVDRLWCICDANFTLMRRDDTTTALERLRTILNQHQEKVGYLNFSKLRLYEARAHENNGDVLEAVRIARQIVSRLRREEESEERDRLLVDALIFTGDCAFRQKAEPASVVLETFLKPGSTLAFSLYKRQKNGNEKRATKAFLSLGQVANLLYEGVSTRVKSMEWQRSGINLCNRVNELKQCDLLLRDAQKRAVSAKGKSKNEAQKALQEIYSYHINLSREVSHATSERETVQKSLSIYRLLAIRSLMDALVIADATSNLSINVYQIVKLWFAENCDLSECQITECVEEATAQIPLFRFVPLCNQLFSRLGLKGQSNVQGLQKCLQNLILKMTLKHPYHCIIHIVSLVNSTNVGSGVSGRNAESFLENADNTKVLVARTLLTQLKREATDFISDLVESYQAMAEAYIFLAMANVSDLQRGANEKIPFSKVCKTASQRLDQCLGTGTSRYEFLPCVITKVPALRPTGDYGDLSDDPNGADTIATFEKTFSITDGGITLPKIIVCIGSRGGRYKQLVKGHDELRQDAVMQQVFGLVNELLGVHRSPKGEHTNTTENDFNYAHTVTKTILKIVTYHIVPLTPASGVLEWVDGTLPVLDVIADRGGKKANVGLHSKYYPGEWGHGICRDNLRNSSPNKRREVFDEICKQHSACFRFFFMERFGDSMRWYCAKQMYSRSVAVNSVVGHIFGIGDRHSSNILVHEKTGEVVHIDFGIVFEQGKLLNVPERVPFRLTRNIVDGLGPTGTKGAFTKACETTLYVLKCNSSALSTILSAIVSDPLYKWSISPVKARQRQRLTERDDDTEKSFFASKDNDEMARLDDISNIQSSADQSDKNEAAAQAISKVQEKLQGYEDGTSGEQQSLEGQIQLLINSARNPDNLCEMFHGWAPWI